MVNKKLTIQVTGISNFNEGNEDIFGWLILNRDGS